MNAQTKVEASLASAMAAAFAEIDAALKSAKNPHFKSKYADITAVIESIKPALINHNLFFTQHPEPSDRGVTIETWLHHASGDSLSLGKLFVPANKQDAQGFGSALTYARRYALVTAFGVPVEDDDGNAAARGQSQQGTVSPAAVVSDAQWGIITDLIEKTGTDVRKFCQAYGIESVKALPAEAFDKARAQLTKKLEQKEPA